MYWRAGCGLIRHYPGDTRPIGGLLVHRNGAPRLDAAISGMDMASYHWVILFTGVCMLASAVVIGLRYPMKIWTRLAAVQQ